MGRLVIDQKVKEKQIKPEFFYCLVSQSIRNRLKYEEEAGTRVKIVPNIKISSASHQVPQQMVPDRHSTPQTLHNSYQVVPLAQNSFPAFGLGKALSTSCSVVFFRPSWRQVSTDDNSIPPSLEDTPRQRKKRKKVLASEERAAEDDTVSPPGVIESLLPAPLPRPPRHRIQVGQRSLSLPKGARAFEPPPR
ncbi:hypothetical protein AVEN_241448-1 [Araneus ventricosus]|uniref:Uncharacterized protein n=1 Tax=Araneus ventricosus TaxID=182803 RepID=A0A4Y2FV51_ARAVE|nr:hypothetical protein AVEN_241448-1 [Araneus ventricosus]